MQSTGGRLVINANAKPATPRSSGLRLPNATGDFDAKIVLKSFSSAPDNAYVHVGLAVGCLDGLARVAGATITTTATGGVVGAVNVEGEANPASIPVEPAGLEFRITRALGVMTVSIARGAAVLVTKSYPAWCPNAPLAPIVSTGHATTFRAELDDFSGSSCTDDFSVNKTYQ